MAQFQVSVNMNLVNIRTMKVLYVMMVVISQGWFLFQNLQMANKSGI